MPQEIDDFATQIAQARPDQPADAPRPRQTFELAMIEDDGPRYVRARVEVSAEFERALERPAQYTTMSYGEVAPRFLVIAAPPGAPDWEFLIDRDSTLGRAMAEAAPGDPVTLSAPEGRGFQLELAQDPLIAFATGSGVATIRPALEHLRCADPARLERAWLYYGEGHAADFALEAERARWAEAGATILLANEDAEEGQGWRYVQQAFQERAPATEQATILVSGAPIMMRMVTELMLTRGVTPARILTNV